MHSSTAYSVRKAQDDAGAFWLCEDGSLKLAPACSGVVCWPVEQQASLAKAGEPNMHTKCPTQQPTQVWYSSSTCIQGPLNMRCRKLPSKQCWKGTTSSFWPVTRRQQQQGSVSSVSSTLAAAAAAPAAPDAAADCARRQVSAGSTCQQAQPRWARWKRVVSQLRTPALPQRRPT